MAAGRTALAQDQQNPVKIGVLAKRGPERCLEKWGPTADYLTDEIPGYSFSIVPLKYTEVHPVAERREVDFILSNPSFYVEAEKLYGANRIATLKNQRTAGVFTSFGGVIFCRADRDDIQDLDDLKGKTFMATSEHSFGGWQVGWRELKERDIDPHRDFGDLTFGGTHDAVVYAVRDGKVDAGTVRTDTLERMVLEGKIRLEDFHALKHNHIGEDACEFPFLHSTDMYPEWPIAKVAHTSDELAEKVAIALIGMPADSPAAKAARCAGWTVPLNYQLVHACLKELRVGPYKDYGKVTFGAVIGRYWPWSVAAAVFLTATVITTLYVLRLIRGLSRSRAGLARELSERKRAEEKLRESEEKHRVITENLPQRMFHKDAHLVYVSCNKHYARDLGIARHEIAGKTDFDFYPKNLAEKYRADDRRIMESGQTEEVEESCIRDGQELIVQTVKTRLTDDAGNVTGILGIFWDITERNRAKEELQRAHLETKQLFEAISSVLIGVDGEDKVTAWNGTAERMFGIEKDNAVGRLFDDLGIQWDHAVIGECISQCRAAKRPTRLEEVSFKRPDGRDGFLGMTLNPLNSGSEKRGGFLLVAADITRKKILQGQLAQSQKLESIGQLAAGIAHEINTPTQFVGDNTRFLQDAFQDLEELLAKYRELVDASRAGPVTPEVLADVDAAEKEADLDYLKEEIPKAIAQSMEGIERVARIVRAMKDFSHPGAEGKESVDLNKAIESTITVARNEWKYVAEMETDFDPAMPLVPCELGEFNQVILNIVINAAHAIADVVGGGGEGKGTITVSTRHDNDWAEVRIRDTGTGISEEHRVKVFDHFFTTKEVGKGTGQGLAIAYSVVTEKHGGTITLESEMGRGTTFIIRLPIESQPTDPVETSQHEEAHSLR